MEYETFVHLELNGSADEIKAFVEGYRLASGEERVYSSARENIKIKGFFGGLVSRAVHFVVPETFAKSFVEAVGAAKRMDIRFENLRPIDHGELNFDFKCFSRIDGTAIREVIESDLPEGIVLEGYTTDEVVNSEAKGPEMYSPVHEYVLTGQGRFHGPIEGVIAMARRLDDQDFIHPGRIHLVYAH